MSPPPAPNGAPAQEDDGQWTRVKPKKGTSRRRPAGPGARDFGTPPNPSPQLDLQQITRDHDRISAAWRESQCHAKLRDLVNSNVASHVTVTKAVCLAVGSFDPIATLYHQKRVAHVQLEAFRAVVEMLEAHNGSPIQRVIQEPAFSDTDKEFCESLGFKTVDTPQAFEMIDSHTLVYGIHLYMPTWAEALSKQLPGCLVGTPFGVCETYHDTHGAGFELAQLQTIDASFDRFPFPQQDTPGDFVFSDTTIYWAKG